MVELLSEYTSLASRSAEMKSEELTDLQLLGRTILESLGNWHSKIVNLIKLLVETYRKAHQAARLCKVQEARMGQTIQHLKRHLQREIENASKLRKRAHDEDSTDFTSIVSPCKDFPRALSRMYVRQLICSHFRCSAAEYSDREQRVTS